MLTHRTGDLFAQADVDALAHGVNCLGKMGSGIAPLFRRRFPDMHTAYQDECRTGRLQVGGMFPWQLPNGRWIYNLATQHRTGADARLDAIETAVGTALTHAAEHALSRVAVPRIGAGIGGLSWADVLEVLHRVADPSPVELVVVSLPGANGPAPAR